MTHIRKEESRSYDPKVARIFYETLNEEGVRKYLQTRPGKRFFYKFNMHL